MKPNKLFKKMLYTLLVFTALIVAGGIVILNLPSFGKTPDGERLERIRQSPNYRDGRFRNLEVTPRITSKRSPLASIYEFLFPKVKDLSPLGKIPAVKTDLKSLDDNVLVWLGHSSYLMRIDGKTVLVDPVFHAASPFPFFIRPFKAEYDYSSKDLPYIDLLIITHDHWDHLDYAVMKEIRSRVRQVFTPLGVGSHLEYWGFPPGNIVELDWYEASTFEGMKITCLPTRHFSGRGVLNQLQTLWGSFMLESAGKTIYIGGDSGYGKHIAEIGRQFPDIDLALMENGQYNEEWRYIHFMPENLCVAMKEFGAKRYFTGHNSKFTLGKHPWYEPLNNVTEFAGRDGTLRLITPRIGEVVWLDDDSQRFEAWWNGADKAGF